MLSNATKYAVNAAIYLATHSSEKNKLSTKAISQATKVPHAFLAKLLQNLAKKGVIASVKGPKGGFFLTEVHKKQPLINVVNEIDGLDKFNECILGLVRCSRTNPCPIHFSIQPLKDKLLGELSNNSISHFAEKVERGEAFLTL